MTNYLPALREFYGASKGLAPAKGLDGKAKARPAKKTATTEKSRKKSK